MRLVPLRQSQSLPLTSREKPTYVVVGLVWTVDWETEVVGLLGGHAGELDTELTQVGSGNLLVEGLGEHATGCQIMERQ